MNKELLTNVSMNGRMAYAIMTIEEYLKGVYPSKDWSILSKEMWKATSTAWDTWAESFIEIIPEYLFEFPTYEESSFEHLSRNDYNAFSDLYSGITSGKSEDELNVLLENLRLIAEVYAYTSIPGHGEGCFEFLDNICCMVENVGITLPAPQIVAFSPFSEKDGWGEDFDGTHLSLILNK